MSEITRFVRLRPDADRAFARNGATYCPKEFRPEQLLQDDRSLFNHHQRRMAKVLREHTRLGVAVFALHPTLGLAGQLWLEGSESLRAATIGRHSQVDLFLPEVEELSLRHFLVLVRRRDVGLRMQVLDLVTPHGFQAEGREVLRALETDGPVVFSAAGYTFVAVPTGAGTPWDSNATDPWSSLPRRVITTSTRSVRLLPRARKTGGDPHGTFVSVLDGPVEAEPEQLLPRGDVAVGRLTVSEGRRRTHLRVGEAALQRGVVLGRYERCAGHQAFENDLVSRVHAVLIEVDGVVHLVDAGSSNGTSLDGQAIACAPVLESGRYRLGPVGLSWKRMR